MTDPEIPHDVAAVRQLGEAYARLIEQLRKRIVGQTAVIEQMLTSVLAGGHCLLVGVPGLAKTLMVHTLADALELSFNRIQFTPDLMPADITGTEVLQEDKATGTRSFRFVQGPLFSNVVLADEINRTPPKTQAALLEAMQEHQVTVSGSRHQLPEPFFVLATQNPIEQEGTYPLPEAQQDRFMLQIRVDYPSEEEEFQIVRQLTTPSPEPIECVLTQEELKRLQDVVRRLPVADHVLRYAMTLARWTRYTTPGVPAMIRDYVTWVPARVQVSTSCRRPKLMRCSTARRMSDWRTSERSPHPALRHRLVTNYNAEADGITPDVIVEHLLQVVPTDAAGSSIGKLPPVFAAAGANGPE